tara:strand:+ start:1691 stop:2302 length:612 start_codon:yes stop_codon:yes gene_type:complete
MTELELQQIKLNQKLSGNFGSVAVILEGRDTAGKTGTIRELTHYIPIKKYSVHLSSKPNSHTMNNWLRYWTSKLPKGNQIIFYDRSWYSRGLVQKINGWCSDEQYLSFMKNVQHWENKKNVKFIKFWLSISEETQERLIEKRKSSPLTSWKFSPNDERALSYFDQMTLLKERVITTTENWNVIDYNDKKKGRLDLITRLVDLI